MEEEKKSSGKEDKNMIAILSYFGVLVIIPLLVAKDDEFVKYHIKQGLVLLIAAVAVSFVAWIPIFGWFVGFFAWLACFALAILGIINVLAGKKKELPLIGQFADKFKI
jgi:uncharacterized membrane protein